MQSNTVDIDAAQNPPALRFAARFNAAVPFVERHLAEGRGAKTAIRTVHGDISYDALAANVDRCAAGLSQLGIHPGERLLMVVKDCPDFFYLFWGAIKAGVIPVPVNTLLRAETYAYMLEDAQPAAIAYSPEYAGEVEAALARASFIPRRLLLTEGGSDDALPALLARSRAHFPAAAATADDDCFWLYSSGSTGAPKAAVHRHRDMVVSSQRVGVETFGMRADDICYSDAKLFFAYGLGNNMTMPLWVGATAVLNERKPGPDTSFPLIEKFRPTIYFGVPTLYAAYLQAIGVERPDLTSLRMCISAGEALPPEILRRWHEATGLWILDGIGSTEALHIFISNRPGDVKPGSSGRLVSGYRARIVDEAGRDAPDGDSGRLFIAGDSTARCYWNNAERTASTMVDGWLNTGDMYWRDADGYYYYRGRSDDMLKVGGIWCSPFEIESRLVEHPAVLEAAVVGRPDCDDLIKPEAFIVLRRGWQADDGLAAELLQFCRDGLAPYKYPRWINFVADLPKTATGKIQRFRLRSAAAAPHGRASDINPIGKAGVSHVQPAASIAS